MSRFAARLLLLLVVLGAFWHPLCACRSTWTGGPASGESSCCASDETPRPDPCGQPPGECGCERELALLAGDGDGVATLRLPTLGLPSDTGLLPLARVQATRPAPTPRAVPLRPPDRCRPLPLRI